MRYSLHSSLVRAALVILISAPSAFCLAAEVTTSTTRAQARDAKVEAAWIRWLPANVPLAGYATITNLANRAIVLTSASSAAFREVSIHRSTQTGGSMQMSPVDAITIAPHDTLDFASQGLHLMLMQPNESLDSTSEIPIALRFADGSSLGVAFQLRKSAAK